MPIAAMKHRIGKIQLRVRRAFIVSNGEAVAFGTLALWAYPRAAKLAHWQRWSIYRACKKFGTSPRRGWWQANPELRRRIER
jgi:hypothetical protein